MEKLSLASIEGALNKYTIVGDAILISGVDITDPNLFAYMFQDASHKGSKTAHNAFLKKVKENEGTKNKVAKLEAMKSSNKCYQIPTYFGKNIPIRYFPTSSEKNSFDVYVVKNSSTNTFELRYRSMSTSTTDLLSIFSDKVEDSEVRKFFKESYLNYCNEVEKPQNIQDFIVTSIKQDLILDSSLMLDQEPEVITDCKKTPNLYYFEPKAIDKTKIKYWLNWLNKIPTKEHRLVFCEWIGSLFDHNNKSRNVLFLVGEGKTAKSVATNTIFGAIERYIGSGTSSISTQNTDERWLTSRLIGKRFVIVPDSSDMHLLSNQVIKTVTGNDITRVEFKGKNEYSARLYSKFLVVSNFSPFCSYKSVHETSRYLLVPIHNNKTDDLTSIEFEKRLEEGVEDFLSLCYNKYIQGGRKTEFAEEGSYIFEYAKNNTYDMEYNSAQKFIVANCTVGMTKGNWINRNVLLNMLTKFYTNKVNSNAQAKRSAFESVEEVIKLSNAKIIKTRGGEQIILGLKVNNPKEICTLSQIVEGRDKSEMEYSVLVDDLPSDIAPEDMDILSLRSYSRNLD
tara:strand:- start:3425 stop:5122 length:1698 start_codon:yes stop_codon:yes gene_type:complete